MGKILGTTENNIWTRNKTAAFRKMTEIMRGAHTSMLPNLAPKASEAPMRPMPALSNDDIDYMLAFDHMGG